MDQPIPPRARRAAPPPKFVTGPLLRHILVMAGTGAVGLMAIFISDLVNMVFLGLLKDEAVLAAVGYGSSILFLTTSIGIGLSIAATSLVSPALGAGRHQRARRLAVNAHLLTFLVSSVLAVLVFVLVSPLLAMLGASGRTLDLAARYLYILVPTTPLLATGMTAMSVLRSAGDARRSMNVTLGGAVINAILDPIFIFALGLGLEGAAISSAIARLAIMAIGLHGVVRVHDLMGRPRWRTLVADAPALAAIAVPAILTNIATPIANAYVTSAIAPFGDGAVAGWAIIGRIIPVAFGATYALSGSIGPVLGQNYGARSFDRMHETLTKALLVMVVFTAVAWLLLALLSRPVVWLFHSEGEAADLIILFCCWLAPLFVFLGAMFIANAAFNTLGHPHVSTVLNWGRATIGTIPFVLAGGALAGADGVLAGNMIGAIPFGILAVWLCYRLVARLGVERAAPRLEVAEGRGSGRTP